MAKLALVFYGFLVFGNMITTFLISYRISLLLERIPYLCASEFYIYVKWAATMTQGSFPCSILSISGANSRDFTALTYIAVTTIGLLFVSANTLREATPSESSSWRICITLSLCIRDTVMESLILMLWLYAKQDHQFYYFSLIAFLQVSL